MDSKSLQVIEQIVIHGDGAVQCLLNIGMVVLRPIIGTVLDAILVE